MLKSAAIYLSSSLIGKLVPFLVLPFLTKYLAPEEFALVALYQALFTVCLALLGNIQASVPKYYINERKQFPAAVGAMVKLLFLLFLLSFIAISVGYYFYADVIGLEGGPAWLVPFVALSGAINLLNLAALRVRERAVEYAFWEVGIAILNVSLTFILVAKLTLNWEGRVIGIFLPIVLASLFSMISLIVRGDISLSNCNSYYRKIFSISIPMIPHSLAAACITLADTFMIAAILGAVEVGIYSIGYQFGMVLVILTDAFSKAWQPKFYRMMKDGEEKLVNKIQLLYVFMLPIIAVVYTAVATFAIPYMVAEPYVSSLDIVPYIVLGYIFFGYYQLIFPYIILLEKTKVLAVITPICALVNILLNLYLLPLFGSIGAAYSTIAAYLLLSVVLYLYIIKVERKV